MNIYDLLIKHEGMRLQAYTCPAGFITIGVGRNLQTNGISKDEALYLLQNDVSRVFLALINRYDWFSELSEARQAVVVSMVFNLGMAGFAEFKKLIQAMAAQDYKLAATEMLSSKWAIQVGNRATELSEMLKRDEFIGVG